MHPSVVLCGALWFIVVPCGALWHTIGGTLWSSLVHLEICCLNNVALCIILRHCYNTARQTCTKPKVPPTGLQQTLIHLNESD